MNRNYTTTSAGDIATPSRSPYRTADALPVILGAGVVRNLAREVAESIIEDARASDEPVVWVTGNRYMPPLRSFTAAEFVYDAENNRDGELWAWFTEMVEDRVTQASVALECPDWDNALYAVDLKRWQYRDEAEGDDLNGEWEPRDPDAVDDNAENPREL